MVHYSHGPMFTEMGLTLNTEWAKDVPEAKWTLMGEGLKVANLMFEWEATLEVTVDLLECMNLGL